MYSGSNLSNSDPSSFFFNELALVCWCRNLSNSRLIAFPKEDLVQFGSDLSNPNPHHYSSLKTILCDFVLICQMLTQMTIPHQRGSCGIGSD